MSTPPKNIVVCSDGTNNQISDNPTNVLRLFKTLVNKPPHVCDYVERIDPKKPYTYQVTFYDPGVGTIAQPGLVNPVAKRLSLAFGLAFGSGFTRNLEEAYRFIMKNYEEGDRVFLYGFSRGAYTARALAGMIHMFGLLHRDQENMLPFITRAYNSANWSTARQVKSSSRTNVRIHFLGVWDTVSALGWAYQRMALPYTANNPAVDTIRHAVAIDERRGYFRQNLWGKKFEKWQDIEEVWFAGVHSDVGGGYPCSHNRLSKIPFQWMVEESKKSHLLIDNRSFEDERDHCESHCQSGAAATQTVTCAPDAGAPMNESLKGAWKILEYLPMNYTLRRDEFFIPKGRRRQAPHDAKLHQSVIDRINAHTVNGVQKYDPYNIVDRKTPDIAPWHQPLPTTTSSYERPPLKDRVMAFICNVLWAISVVYLVPLLLCFLCPIAVAVYHGVMLGKNWPPEWGHLLLDAVVWPCRIGSWLLKDSNWLIVIPLAVFPVTAALRDRLSGIYKYQARVWGPLLHRRSGGFEKKHLLSQMYYLRPEGRPHYIRMLQLDVLFSGFAYAWLFVAVQHATRSDVSTGNVIGSSMIWAVYWTAVAANFVETGRLLWQLHRNKETIENLKTPPSTRELLDRFHPFSDAWRALTYSFTTPVKLATARAVVFSLVAALVIARIFDYTPEGGVSVGAAYCWCAFLIALPWITFRCCAKAINRISGFAAFEKQYTGTPLHTRLLDSYNAEDADAHFNELRGETVDDVMSSLPEEKKAKQPDGDKDNQDGRLAYRNALYLDLFFPLFYASTLIFALHEAYARTSTFIPCLIVFLPVITVIADWVENGILINQINRHIRVTEGSAAKANTSQIEQSTLSAKAICIASWATCFKIVSFGISILALLYMLMRTIIDWQ